MAEHCWHEKAAYTHHGVQCCNCGIRWWEGMTIPLQGHGKFAPKQQLLPRPNKECVPPDRLGKQGRAATLEDVDFTKVSAEKG